MSQDPDREGTFRAEIIDYSLLAPFKSGAIPLSIDAKLLAMWDADAGEEEGQGDWVPWEEYDVVANGLQWLVKKDGSLNESTAQNLMEHAGWDGDFESLSNRTWKPTPCQVVINEEKDPERSKWNEFPIAFVNAWDASVGSRREMDKDMAKQLKTQHGAALRALKGNTKRNAAAPKGKPANPPKSKPENDANKALLEAGQPAGKDDIPF